MDHEWVNDRTHGQQFKARFLRTSPPTSADGIEKYLSSGMIRGIGPAYAKKLLRAFGEKVFDIIEATPDPAAEPGDWHWQIRTHLHHLAVVTSEKYPVADHKTLLGQLIDIPAH